MKKGKRRWSVVWALAAAAFWVAYVAGPGAAYAGGGRGGHAGHFGGHGGHFGGHAGHMGHGGHLGHIDAVHHVGHLHHFGHLHHPHHGGAFLGFGGRSWWWDDPLPSSPFSFSPLPLYYDSSTGSYYCYDPSGFYYPCTPFPAK